MRARATTVAGRRRVWRHPGQSWFLTIFVLKLGLPKPAGNPILPMTDMHELAPWPRGAP
jgi:hypothetical protein